MPTNAFQVAWLSPDLPPTAMRASYASNPLLYLFRDGEFTATFACITPICLITQFHACTSQPDEPPRVQLIRGALEIHLVNPCPALPGFTKRNSWAITRYAALQNVECGDKYLLNLATAEITAKVEELITERTYRIKAEEEKVIPNL